MDQYERMSHRDQIQLVINLYMIVTKNYEALKAANPDNVDGLHEKWLTSVKRAKAAREQLWAKIDEM